MAIEPRDSNQEIADANALFDDAEPTTRPTRNARASTEAAPGEYDIEGFDSSEVDAPVRPPIPAAPSTTPKRPAKSRPVIHDDDEPRRPKIEARVDEVWTRWGEWGSTVLLEAVIVTATILAAYFVASSISFGLAFLVFVAGIALAVVVSYPIVITLERPVRMTPEQAVKDFYAAASHHFPHYKRMWLLLSTNGKTSSHFDSFATFRTYWKHRAAQLRGSTIKSSTPLDFEVVDFKSEKSAGLTDIDGTYSLIIKARGTEAPLKQFSTATTLVRGPDKMWYLNIGTLPEK